MAHPHFVFDEIADFFVSHRCLNPIPLGGGYLLPLLFNKLNTMAIFIFKFRYGGIGYKVIHQSCERTKRKPK